MNIIIDHIPDQHILIIFISFLSFLQVVKRERNGVTTFHGGVFSIHGGGHVRYQKGCGGFRYVVSGEPLLSFFFFSGIIKVPFILVINFLFDSDFKEKRNS